MDGNSCTKIFRLYHYHNIKLATTQMSNPRIIGNYDTIGPMVRFLEIFIYFKQNTFFQIVKA